VNLYKIRLGLIHSRYYAMESFTMHLFKALLLSLVVVASPVLFANHSTDAKLPQVKPSEAKSTEAEPTEAELERWFNSDDFNPPEFKQVEVNDGILFFLTKPPLKPVHHHQNTLTLYQNSLNNGWVKLEQCHSNLDRVAALQVMFNKNKVRDINITKALSIEKAWVENNSVQLENIHDNAVLCIQAWSKALVKNKDGSYGLSNGPFMRKFLDGYYPIHVTININFKATDLKLVQFKPMVQSGFNVTQTPQSINMDAWFEGRLKTQLTFVN